MPTDTDDLTSAEQRVRAQSVYTEIAAERERQDAKWGPVRRQPDVDPVLAARDGNWAQRIAEEHEIPTETRAKFLCQNAERRGECSFTHIVVEELAEAVAKYKDVAAMRVELVQLAASVVKWIEAIDLEEAQPSAPTGEPPPTRDIWTLAEEAQREVDAWPAWKRRAADQALVTTGEPDATEGPADEAPGVEPCPGSRTEVVPRSTLVVRCNDCGADLCANPYPHPDGTSRHMIPPHLRDTPKAAAPTVEPPEPDEDRTKPPPSYEVFSVDEDEPPTGPPVWGWIVNRESPADHGEWFGTAAEAVADAWRDYDKFTAPLRARAETAERERDNWEREARACAREAERRKEERDEARERVVELEAEAEEASSWTEQIIDERDRRIAERDEARERAAAVERERDTLRALLKRCDATLRPFTPLDCGTLLTDIRTALHQPKE